jgi:alkanesulfonate monooxygenase SsuD/methylene tetrahydromethanopterin reductase-like flavin-dependent oxidoreductase (luciferase family)
VIGAIAQVTKSLRLGTGVTCPTMRIHPALERLEEAVAVIRRRCTESPRAALRGRECADLQLAGKTADDFRGREREEDVARSVLCNADPQAHVEAIEEFVEAGYDHVYVHQVGPDQEGAIEQSFPASDPPAWTVGGRH